MKSNKVETDAVKHDLLCPKHKAAGSKGWLIHVIDGFVIEESSVPFQVKTFIWVAMGLNDWPPFSKLIW